MMTLLEALKNYQVDKVISDYQLAKILGISQAQISRITSGKHSFGYKTLRAIAEKIPSLKPYVSNYIINGDVPLEMPGPGRPTWQKTLEKDSKRRQG